MVYDGTVGKNPSVSAEDMTVFYTEREDKVLDTLDKYEHATTFVQSPINGYEVEVLDIKANTPTMM